MLSAKQKVEKLLATAYNSDLTVETLTTLLLEHERDTRYTAIDVINENTSSKIIASPATGLGTWTNVLITEDIINKIHNLKVGE